MNAAGRRSGRWAESCVVTGRYTLTNTHKHAGTCTGVQLYTPQAYIRQHACYTACQTYYIHRGVTVSHHNQHSPTSLTQSHNTTDWQFDTTVCGYEDTYLLLQSAPPPPTHTRRAARGVGGVRVKVTSDQCRVTVNGRGQRGHGGPDRQDRGGI